MTDPTLSRLLAALEALERTTPHAPGCDRHYTHLEGATYMADSGSEGVAHDVESSGRCTCDYDVRRRLAIAQRTERAIEIAADWFVGQVAEEWGGEPSALRKVATDAAVAAFASPGREREDT